MLFAFVDESARRRSREGACVYTLAAVIVPEPSLDEVRETMLALRYGRTPRVHWRDERAERLEHIAKAVAALPMSGVVTVYLHDPAVGPERARRLCLKVLLRVLSARGVDAICFESRRAEQDARDRALLVTLRKQPGFRREVTVGWTKASDDPALWAADVVAGALTWWLDGGHEYWEALSAVVDIVEVDP
ncbi:hypothetical protein [Nocardia asteroides]|uniref:hypothetical protein n=1 Tax=Nocardia asteroides TaxID=1824 RepID=UPI001E38B4DB|nr:hypothetical protein [Nocardia asteroides]UGT64488.1 hypothetical protein LTT61_14890 [Nocardia asteroides]